MTVKFIYTEANSCWVTSLGNYRGSRSEIEDRKSRVEHSRSMIQSSSSSIEKSSLFISK